VISILQHVRDGTMDVAEAQKRLQDSTDATSTTQSITSNETLASFANLDHDRARRTGFPEAVFGAGKTPHQVAAILDEMARNVNLRVAHHQQAATNATAILATRYARN
jgi:NCAIR mutase (PurE)-related protein